MFRTIIWFIYFWIHLIITLPALQRVKKLEKTGQMEAKEELVYKTSRNWARKLVKLAGGKVDVNGYENLPKDEACLFVSNHQGNFDIPILIGFLNKPVGFISKIEVKKLPILNKWMEHMNCIFMDRKDRRQAVKSINTGAEKLKDGSSLVIFPEGTRSKGMDMNSFKAGSFKLAQKSGVTIVPVVINGSYKIMEQNGFKIRPADVTVTILSPIPYEQYKEKDMKQVAEDVETLISQELNKTNHSIKKS